MSNFEIGNFSIAGDEVRLILKVDGKELDVVGELHDYQSDDASLVFDDDTFKKLEDAGIENPEVSVLSELDYLDQQNVYYSSVKVDEIKDFEPVGEGQYALATVNIDTIVWNNYYAEHEEDLSLTDVKVVIGHLPDSGGWTVSIDEEAIQVLSEKYGAGNDFEGDIAQAIDEYLDVDMVLDKHLSEGVSASEHVAKVIINSISNHKRSSFDEEKIQVNDEMADVLLDDDLPSDLYIEASSIEYGEEFGGEVVDAGAFSFSVAGKEYFIDGIEMNDGVYSDDPVFIPEYVEKELVSAGVPEYAAVAIGRAADSVWRVQMDVEERLGREQRLDQISEMSM